MTLLVGPSDSMSIRYEHSTTTGDHVNSIWFDCDHNNVMSHAIMHDTLMLRMSGLKRNNSAVIIHIEHYCYVCIYACCLLRTRLEY